MQSRTTCRGRAPTWIARVMEERMENVSGCCRSLAHHRKTSGNAMWCRTCRSEIGAGHCVAKRGLERRHQRHPGHDDQYPLVCLDYGYLSGDATPILVAKDRRTGMIFALSVERKGAADPHAVEQLAAWVDMLGSSQMAIRSDGEPAVMQVAAAGQTQEEGSVTPWRHLRQVIMLEMVWPREQWDWWVAWSGHSRMSLSSSAKCRYHQNRRPLLG